MPDDVLRVVVARRGRVKPAEFRLRAGEVGLSLFRRADPPGTDAILTAVRSAGKQGELAVALIPVQVIRELGLRLVRTPGGTPDPGTNRLHVEARLPWWRTLVLRLRGRAVHEWFNEHAAPRLAESARLED